MEQQPTEHYHGHDQENEQQQTPTHTSRQVRTPTSSDVNYDYSEHEHENEHAHAESDPSEPSLRFPRPIGNTHLAHWISNSDPDIMRITSESVKEDSGLADSTYELLTHADDTASENESHYEHNDESFSESVSSLDQKRSDDVHSVSEDDEEDVPMLVQAPLPISHLPSRSETPAASTVADDGDATDDESDTNSRSSLEYTQEKLDTPSMGLDETPKASTVWKTKASKQEKCSGQEPRPAAIMAYEMTRDAFNPYYTQVRDDVQAFQDAFKRRHPNFLAFTRPYITTAKNLSMFIMVGVLHAVICLVSSYRHPESPVPFLWFGPTSKVAVTPIATTTAATSSIPRALTTARTDLNVRDEGSALDWIFSRDIGLAYSTVDNTFVVDIPAPLKDQWLSNDCVVVHATREGKQIETNLHKVEKGVSATLPRRERYGDVEFLVQSSCKPNIKQTVTVNFGQYENELTALARQTKDLVLRVAEEQASSWANAYDFIVLSSRRDIVPVCRELEKAVRGFPRRLTDAKRAAQDSVGNFFTSKVGELLETVDLAERKTELVVRDAQASLQFRLLNSQIAAKLWWLKLTHQDEEREAYRFKAAAYVARKERDALLRAAAREQECKRGCTHSELRKGA